MPRLLTVLLLASVLVACGDDEEAATVAATPAVTAAAVPADLIGTSWQATLKTSELEDAPDDLKGKTSDWALSFRPGGGNEDGPSMVLVNDELGEIVNPISITGDVLELGIPTECRRYSFAVENDELLLTPVSTCPAESIKSVLTTKPWKRSKT